MRGGDGVNEAEAVAVLVASGVPYGAREAALRAAGSALSLLEEPDAYAAQLGERGILALRRGIRGGEALLARLSQDGVRLIVRGGAGYPDRLCRIAQPPHLLFAWGDADLGDSFPFAVVGTRGASAYGLRQTRAIARDLAQAGVCIVSGLALGIDAAGHEGALDANGRTVAVLGGALDRLYPPQNRLLLHRILGAGGSVVTEYPPGTPPTRYSFLRRNRIIAGLCLGVLVTEGARRSGALRTAQDALEEGREVFALPGSVESPGSQLPHMLLAEGAHIATCAQDILDALVIEPGQAARRAMPDVRSGERLPDSTARVTSAERTASAADDAARDPEKARASTFPCVPPGLGTQEQAVCRALLCGEADFDALCEGTGISSEEMGALLSDMELGGLVRAVSGLVYAPGEAMLGEKA